MMNFKIGNKNIGENNNCLIIAEIGQAHEGSLGLAHSYIDAVKDCGVDAVKFQTHIADQESSEDDKFRTDGFHQDKTRFDYWKRMEFTHDQWSELKKHADDAGLIFLSTPFSIKALDILQKIGVEAWKIGSGDTNNIQLIDYAIDTKKPLLISTGMSDFEELDSITKRIKSKGNDFALFQCTTSYPCKAEEVGYNIIEELKLRFNCPVGLSDHTGEIYPSLSAVTLGAKIIETHAVFSKQSFGPDVTSSLDLDQLKDMVRGIRFIEKGLNNKIDKNFAANKRSATKILFSRSAYYSEDQEKGTEFKENSFIMKKPGGGLSYDEVKKFIGKKIKNSKKKSDIVQSGDFNES